VQQIPEIGIRLDAVAADERDRACEQRLLGGIATNGSEQRQLLQCLGKRRRGRLRVIGGNPG
jgi:hypothetical protein